MAYKPSLRNLHRNCWLPEQGQKPVIQRNQNVELSPFSRTTTEKAGFSVLGEHPLFPPALGEMLASDNYEVVLVSRGEPIGSAYTVIGRHAWVASVLVPDWNADRSRTTGGVRVNGRRRDASHVRSDLGRAKASARDGRLPIRKPVARPWWRCLLLPGARAWR